MGSKSFVGFVISSAARNLFSSDLNEKQIPQALKAFEMTSLINEL
jgi:hypothetical protein